MPAPVPGEGLEVERADQLEQRVGGEPEGGPGDQVAADEGSGRPALASARPSSRLRRWTVACATTIGATDGNIIAAIITTQTVT